MPPGLLVINPVAGRPLVATGGRRPPWDSAAAEILGDVPVPIATPVIIAASEDATAVSARPDPAPLLCRSAYECASAAEGPCRAAPRAVEARCWGEVRCGEDEEELLRSRLRATAREFAAVVFAAGHCGTPRFARLPPPPSPSTLFARARLGIESIVGPVHIPIRTLGSSRGEEEACIAADWAACAAGVRAENFAARSFIVPCCLPLFRTLPWTADGS